MCPEITIKSSLIQQLFNSGYDKWLPYGKHTFGVPKLVNVLFI